MTDLSEILSIYIPTYNRADKVGELLNQLNSINNNYCSVNVIDNCSDDDTFEVIDSIKQGLNFPFHYHKNQVNVGLSGNLIKCIENCKTDWLWIIGDDDSIDKNAFKTLSEMNLGVISNETIYVNFSTPNLFFRHEDFFSIGLEDYVAKLDSFSNFVFISSSIINVKLVKNYLRFAYLYSNTLVPHISVILGGLSDNNFKILFSKQTISTFTIAANEEKWSFFNYYKNIHSLLDFFSKSRIVTYTLFREKVLKTIVLDSNYLNAVISNKQYNSIFKKELFNNVFFQLLKKPNGLSFKKKTIFWSYYFIVNLSLARYIYVKFLNNSVTKYNSNLSFQPLNSRV